MVIENAKYQKDLSDIVNGINADIYGVSMTIPLEVGNRHYDEAMRQVAASTLTIADAD